LSNSTCGIFPRGLQILPLDVIRDPPP